MSELSSHQVAALAALKGSPLRVGDVATAIGVTVNGTLQMLFALRQRGLIRQKRSNVRRSRTGSAGMGLGAALWSLTNAGLAVVAQMPVGRCP